MDIMAGWLSDTLQKDLGGALDITSSQPSAESKLPYEDDGSNLRVKMSKPGIVQIIKVSSVFFIGRISNVCLA